MPALFCPFFFYHLHFLSQSFPNLFGPIFKEKRNPSACSSRNWKCPQITPEAPTVHSELIQCSLWWNCPLWETLSLEVLGTLKATQHQWYLYFLCWGSGHWRALSPVTNEWKNSSGLKELDWVKVLVSHVTDSDSIPSTANTPLSTTGTQSQEEALSTTRCGPNLLPTTK